MPNSQNTKRRRAEERDLAALRRSERLVAEMIAFGVVKSGGMKYVSGYPQRTQDGLPIIPGLPEPTPRPADGAVAVCGVCGLRILPVMGYVCPNLQCGVFPRVTC